MCTFGDDPVGRAYAPLFEVLRQQEEELRRRQEEARRGPIIDAEFEVIDDTLPQIAEKP